MKINLQTVGFTPNEHLVAYVNEKLNKLDTYYDQIIAADVYMKIDNNNSKDNKVLDVRLEVPGDDIVVSKKGQAYEECVDLAADTLKKLIIKRKEKMSKY